MQKRGANIYIPGVIFTVIVFVLAGCGDSPPPTTKPPAKATQQPIQSIQSATSVTTGEGPKEVYRYVTGGRKDPFAPIIVKAEARARGADRPPLERHNISEFKLSGIVWGGFGYNAMVEGPDGKGYFVRVGTIIGPNGGVVKKISQNALVIEEKFRTLTGETQRKEIIVELRKKREDNP